MSYLQRINNTTTLVPSSQPLLNRKFGTDLEARRWWILLAFSLFSASSAVLWITYSPILPNAEDYYGVDVSGIVQFSDASMYVYTAFSFLGSWLAYKWFTASLLSAMVLNLIGGWLRYYAAHTYFIALIGQYFAGIAQNVLFFVPVLIADRWFSAGERIWASTIATLSYLVGWAVGFILPPFLIEELGTPIRTLLFYEAIIATVPFVIAVFCVRDRPEIPPSYSALLKMTDHDSFWSELKTIFTDKKYLAAAICFGNLVGQSYTFSSVIVLFIPHDSLVQQGIVGITFVCTGIIAGLVGTAILTCAPKINYDILNRIFMGISVVCLVVLAILIKSDNTLPVVLTLSGLLGIGLLGFQPFACQTLVEMTFPVQESISVNLMMVMGQVFGIIGNFFTTAPFVGNNGMWSLVALVAPCGLYILFFHKTVTKRQDAEKNHQRIDEDMARSIVEENLHSKKSSMRTSKKTSLHFTSSVYSATQA